MFRARNAENSDGSADGDYRFVAAAAAEGLGTDGGIMHKVCTLARIIRTDVRARIRHGKARDISPSGLSVPRSRSSRSGRFFGGGRVPYCVRSRVVREFFFVSGVFAQLTRNYAVRN